METTEAGLDSIAVSLFTENSLLFVNRETAMLLLPAKTLFFQGEDKRHMTSFLLLSAKLVIASFE